MDLKDKVAVVTGAARGIGRAIAVALARRGATVAACDVALGENADETVRLCREAGGEGRAFALDVSQPARVTEVMGAVAAAFGHLDILVNNAGIAIDGLLLRTKDEDWGKVLDVNLSGVFFCCRAAARHLLKAKDGGRIVNVTSVVGEQGNPGQVSYAASKAGIIGLTKTLARELAGRSLCVNAVSPGFIDTVMTAEHVQGKAREELLAKIPLGRIGAPEDIANAVAFLCSPEASYITGQVLRVNGGMLM
ncbi:MAG TPA: beta-ketoacyl-ACP reductase [Polyangia bacterium]|jgi:3-oxoacyl-[acyl-carrier protein] reductase